MISIRAAFAAACLVTSPLTAHADNPMGYRLMTQQEASQLPRNHGILGLDVDRGEQISESGMTFDIMRVKEVRRDSPGAHAGLRQGDQIIAVNGLVFPTIASFAAYVGSTMPGSQITIDYMPAGTGPQQAQRVAVTVGGAGQIPPEPASGGMSTGKKLAIGAGAIALLGCYEMGCFSHRTTNNGQNQPQQ